MARFVDAIDLVLPPEAAFDLLADFSRTQDWDPGVVEGRRLDRGPLGSGSRFEVVASFLGRRVPLRYEILVYERPHRLLLEARDGALRSLDEVTFAAREGGTRITYEARLELTGLARLMDPLLQLAFPFVGRAAADGLRRYGAQLAAEASGPARRRTRVASAG